MMVVRSPAKVNLFLRVLGKRDDGYHHLSTLMQTISLFDYLHIALADQDQLTCTDFRIPTDKRNLVWRAVDLFRKKTGLSFQLRILLEKNIPSEAGLGGGSGNAASVLWALNELCGKPASLSTLMHWAAEIGSDVPFFFSKGTAHCTGRGECVQELEHLDLSPFWVVKPSFGLSTAAVYRKVQIKNDQEASELVSFLLGQPCYINDLEEAAFKEAPHLKAVKEELEKLGFSKVMMTGSGSALLCFGEGNPDFNSYSFSSKVSAIRRDPIGWY